MEMLIQSQKDRCKLIHEIAFAPIGSRVVVITEPVTEAAIKYQEKVHANAAENYIDAAITNLNELGDTLEFGSVAKQTILDQIMTLLAAKLSLFVREPAST